MRMLSRTARAIVRHLGGRPMADPMPAPAAPAAPTVDLPYRVLVGTHHKAGTVWMINVFSNICQGLGLRFDYRNGEPPQRPWDVFQDSRSQFLLDDPCLPCRGLHLIRDPRDILVSATYYHQKSEEPWLHVKRPDFGGLTYQMKLNSLPSLEDKILFEMENGTAPVIQDMARWNYEDPRFFEAKYEDLVADTDLRLFHEIFSFLGFPGSAIPHCLRVAHENSLFSGLVNNPKHIRSGKSGQWKEHLRPVHKARFQELFGDLLVRLGYESSSDWEAGARTGSGAGMALT